MTNAVNLASAAGTGFAFRNRIINGDMRIDQRNAGASTTPSASAGNNYSLDRWSYVPTQASKFTLQQGTSTPPDGFANFFSATVASAVSVGASDNFSIRQYIEGFNFFDLNFGTATAKTVTLSFWVRSSLTGTFGGSFANYAGTRSYPFSYTISAANTWEYKTITIPGDTSGTWAGSSNAGAAIVHFGFGCGSTYTGAAGSWSGNYYIQPTSTVSLVGTAGATWHLTGVQLEVGSVATPFERRPYGLELELCRRYCYAWGSQSPEFVAANSSGLYSDANQIQMIPFGDGLAKLRTNVPTITTVGTQGTDWLIQTSGGVNQTGFTITSSNMRFIATKTSHGITNGNANLQTVSTSGRIIASTEL